MRRVLRVLVVPFVWLAMPWKMLAYRIGPGFVRRLMLELSAFWDWAMVFMVVQNPAMLIHYRAYGGNFFFGKAVMLVDHDVAKKDIVRPTMRGNRFMGVDLVHNDPIAFATNAGPIAMGQPSRGLIRAYIDTSVLTPAVRAHDAATLPVECREILDDWKASPDMAKAWPIRAAITRLFLRLLAGKTLPKKETDTITVEYARRFSELSLLARYAPFLLGLAGTREGIRRDVFIPLKRHGVDPMVIDLTLFAAMFSVGTIVLKCIDFIGEEKIDYRALGPREKLQFVVEAARLCPTVTSVHRIVEEPETVVVRGRTIALGPGDEVAYPFICINRDPTKFTDPDELKIDRPREEVERSLSWSAGPHVCPAKDLSILVTVMMLDTLAERFDIRTLRIPSPEF
jgi:hypothetical protein